MIEEDIAQIKEDIKTIGCMVNELRHHLISEKNNPSENIEKDAKFDRANNIGDEPRYCKQCNAKLGNNRDSPSGLCKKCEKNLPKKDELR